MFNALSQFENVTIVNDGTVYIFDNSSGYGIPYASYMGWPADWRNAVLRAGKAVKFGRSGAMSGAEMAEALRKVYAGFNDAAWAESLNPQNNRSRFSSQDETKEDF